jgi:hypothetical protein
VDTASACFLKPCRKKKQILEEMEIHSFNVEAEGLTMLTSELAIQNDPEPAPAISHILNLLTTLTYATISFSVHQVASLCHEGHTLDLSQSL